MSCYKIISILFDLLVYLLNSQFHLVLSKLRKVYDTYVSPVVDNNVDNTYKR